MIRWLFIVAGVAGFGLMVWHGTQMAALVAFIALLATFATFCLQYEGPNDRARARVQAALMKLQPNSDARTRLESAKVVPSAIEKNHPMNAMTMLNIVSGVACMIICAWAVWLWLS